MKIVRASIDVIEDRLPAAAGLLTRLRAVPDALRNYDVGRREAKRLYGFTSELLDRLVELGLPHLWADGEDAFDCNDLMNISLYAGLRSFTRIAMQSWTTSLRRTETVALTTATVHFVAPKRPGAELVLQDYRVLLPQRGWSSLHGAPGKTLTTLRVQQQCKAQMLPNALHPLLRELAEIRFVRLPERLRWDVAFIERTGLGDCTGTSKLATARARALGFTARQCLGLLLTEPFSTPHYWFEIEVDGAWVAADPVTLATLHKVTSLDSARWPVERSPGGVLVPITDVREYEPNHGLPVLRGCEHLVGVTHPLGLDARGGFEMCYPTTFEKAA